MVLVDKNKDHFKGACKKSLLLGIKCSMLIISVFRINVQCIVEKSPKTLYEEKKEMGLSRYI
jgi:hypothetical protein